MAQRQHAQSSRDRALAAIHLKPVRADIHPTVQLPEISLRPRPDRRNFVERERLLLRVRQEFEDMPGLSLTLPQAVRLLGVPPEMCLRVLTTLVARGLLRVTSRGRRFDTRDNVYRSV
jgi:hypothetical protein